MDVDTCHPFGAKTFDVAPGFLETLWTTAHDHQGHLT